MGQCATAPVPVMAPAARLSATAFWLTYSQSRLNKENVLAALQERGALKRACVCQETHGDGGLHIHALVEFHKKKDVTSLHFDIEGEHPNVLVWDRDAQYEVWLLNHWNYCYKEDESPLVVGDRPDANRKRTRNESVLECVEVAKRDGLVSAQERALQLMAADYAKGVNSYDRLFARYANYTPPIPAMMPAEFPNAPTIPENWRTLFIWGATGLGKSQWARSLLPNAVVVRHASQLAEARFRDGIIFDDFPVSRWPPTSVIALLDWDLPSGINVKYGSVTIPPHTRKIFSFNEGFEKWCRPVRSKDEHGDEMTDMQFRALVRRVTVVHVTASLFGPTERKNYSLFDATGALIRRIGAQCVDEQGNEVFGFNE